MTMDSDVIYLDNAATTRVDPVVREAMLPFFTERYGNPATLYNLGAEASSAVEVARTQVAALIGAEPEEIYFTSGGTESDNWAIVSTALVGEKRHLIVSSIEHHAVLETCEWLEKLGLGVETTVLPVDSLGRVAPDDLRGALRDDTALVSIMHANNEVGTLQDLAALSAVAAEGGVPFHTDAVQSVGKVPVDVQALGVDMLSMSAHKLHGPKGVGALYLRKGRRLPPLLHGGGQERRRRSGTLNVPGIVGFGCAADLAVAHLVDEPARLHALVERLWEGVSAGVEQVRRNGDPEGRIPNILNITLAGAEGEALLMYLNLHHGICASSGSACTTGSLEPSHVLLALGVAVEEAHGSLRFSLSRFTTDDEIDRTIAAVPEEVARVRAMSPTWPG